MENYISLQKSQLLDSLENQVRFSQLVAVLVGEKGIGKSYTLEQLHQRLSDEICIAHIDASLDIQEDQLQKVICLQLGLPSQQLDSVEHIEKSIRNNLRKKALISIDNAHLLSNDSLNSLLQLNQSQINHQESVLFLLLAGDESLPKNISFTNTFKQHQEMCVVFQLEAIEKSEVSSLVAAISQLNIDEIEGTFGSKQLDYFWQLSKGIPAELEYQVSRWQSGLPKEQANAEAIPQEKTSYWKAIVYLALGVIFVSILFYQDEINKIISPDSNTSESSAILTPAQDKLGSKRKVKKAIYKGVINQQQIKQTPTLESGSSSGQNDNKETPKTLNSNDSASNSLNIDKSIEGKKSMPPIKNIPSLKKTESKLQVIKPITSNIKNKTLEGKTQESKKNVNKLISKLLRSKDELFLLAQPSSYLSLQWLGVSQLDNAKTFRSNHPLKSAMYIYRRKQSNKSYLYLVVSDLFNNHSDANIAREKYKKANYPGTPWIKSLSAIQNEINQ